MANEFLFATNVSPAVMIRLEQICRGWRQIDLVKRAGVTQAEVSTLEQGLYVITTAPHLILQTLDLDSKAISYA